MSLDKTHTIRDYNPQIPHDATVFFVSSSVYSSLPGYFTPEERRDQTVQTLQSIRRFVSSAYIIIAETTELTAEDTKKLSPLADDIVLFPDLRQVRNKNIGEKGSIYLLTKKLIDQHFSRIFKISGRYSLVEGFDVSLFSSDTFTFRRAVWKPERPCFLTVLYSLPYSKFAEYFRVLEQCLQDPLDIEHCFYKYLIRSDPQIIDQIFVEGYEANGNYFRG